MSNRAFVASSLYDCLIALRLAIAFSTALAESYAFLKSIETQAKHETFLPRFFKQDGSIESPSLKKRTIYKFVGMSALSIFRKGLYNFVSLIRSWSRKESEFTF